LSAFRVSAVPAGRLHRYGRAALELLDLVGLKLEGWQQQVFEASLLERDGKWAASEVGLVVPRQNGKSELALARILAGLFVLEEELIIYTAHLADTSMEMFRRLIDLIESCDDLHGEVGHVWRANGKETIELATGQRVRFRTRTKGGGRGYAGVATVIFDEAMIFPEASLGSIYPVVSRSPNPQLWFLGSAVDQLVHDEGHVLARVRERGLSGEDPSLAYFEASLPYRVPDDVPAEVAADPAQWKVANPSSMIPDGHIANEQRSLDPRTFAVERLGVGDWPALDGSDVVIPGEAWGRLLDRNGAITGDHCFAFDVTPDHAYASVGVAGYRPDGLLQVELVEHRRSMGWLIPWLAERKDSRVICDARGPAASLLPDLERNGVRVEPVTSAEHAKACGLLYVAVMEGTLRHLGDPKLASALAGARKRPYGDAWAWDRRSGADISPLVAVTLALWGVASAVESDAFMVSW
jgi:hypothetical protein